MKRVFIAAVACSLLLIALAGSGKAQTNPSVTWDTDNDWAGTYENARVYNGSVDIGIYPPEPDFSGSGWTFNYYAVEEVDELTAGYSGGRAYFYSRDHAGIGGETGQADAHATDTFYIDSAGIENATLEFWWKGSSTTDGFNQGDGYTILKIQLQKPDGSWTSIDGNGNLWTKRFDTPSTGGEGTQTVSIPASELSQSGNYTMKIYVCWYLTPNAWNTEEKFEWYVDDISFGLTKATHTTSWKDMGATSAWLTLESGTSIGSGQSIAATVQVSDDMSTVKGEKAVTLSALQSDSISGLPNARYVRIVSNLTTGSEANGPRLDNYKVTADPIPTLTSGGVSPDNGPLNTTFTYTVTYTDVGGDAPAEGYPKVYIDAAGYSMTKMSGDCASGAVYSYTTNSLTTGSHTYYFEASDGTTTVRLPTSGTYSGPTVSKGPTSLTISPSRFALYPGYSGQVQSLTATLRGGDYNPLANETVTWSATSGTVEPSSGTTDAQGQVSVVYTAPTVTVDTPQVTITASFAGDNSYQASSGTSSGVPALPVSENISASAGGTVVINVIEINVTVNVLVVPPNALAADTTVTVTPAPPENVTDHVMLSEVFDVGPSGTTFTTPSTLTLPYNENELPEGVSEDNLAIYRRTGPKSWERVGGNVDNAANTVTVQIDHLSAYAVMAETPTAVSPAVAAGISILGIAALVCGIIIVAFVLLWMKRSAQELYKSIKRLEGAKQALVGLRVNGKVEF